MIVLVFLSLLFNALLAYYLYQTCDHLIKLQRSMINTNDNFIEHTQHNIEWKEAIMKRLEIDTGIGE